MRFIKIAIIILAIMPVITRADSPITSTDFYTAYLDVKMVEEASKTKMMTEKIAQFLMSNENPIDRKAAVINALSWDIEGKKNAELFKIHLATKYGSDAKDLKLSQLDGDELFCLGYLTIMDDYFSPEKAIPILEKAKNKNPQSFTVAVVLMLAKSQKAMDSGFCDVWKLASEVFSDGSLKQDMRPEAKKIIYDYLVIYKTDCQ